MSQDHTRLPPTRGEGQGQTLSLEEIVKQAVDDAFSRGEAHGRFMERHEAIMRDSLAAIERAEAARAALAHPHPPGGNSHEG